MPALPYQVMTGAAIPAALVTGIQSDLSGVVIGMVTDPLYDTATGRHLLIAQGLRIVDKTVSSPTASAACRRRGRAPSCRTGLRSPWIS